MPSSLECRLLRGLPAGPASGPVPPAIDLTSIGGQARVPKGTASRRVRGRAHVAICRIRLWLPGRATPGRRPALPLSPAP